MSNPEESERQDEAAQKENQQQTTDSQPKPVDAPLKVEENTSPAESTLKDLHMLSGPELKELQNMQDAIHKILSESHKALVGQEAILKQLFIALVAGGHVLLEGLPGIAKTMTVRVLSKCVNSGFSRIQFTPDLLPSDITGTSIYNLQAANFEFKKGPIFSNLILIDEINRAPAKTQAALMEVMEEKQINFDGKTYPMDKPFMVLATQNPIEQEGTYALPEAQQDRFMFKIKLDYPDLKTERAILELYKTDFGQSKEMEVEAVVSPEQIAAFRKISERIHVKDEILDYIAQIVHNTRQTPDLHLGASPRATRAILQASKVMAGLNGREFVVPDDVKEVCVPVLNHRVILAHEREMEGATTEEVIEQLVASLEVPR